MARLRLVDVLIMLVLLVLLVLASRVEFPLYEGRTITPPATPEAASPEPS